MPDINKLDTGIESGTDSTDTSLTDCTLSPQNVPKSITLPSKLDIKNMEWDELDELLQVERKIDVSENMYQTMPVTLPSQVSVESTSTMSNSSSNSSKTER